MINPDATASTPETTATPSAADLSSPAGRRGLIVGGTPLAGAWRRRVRSRHRRSTASLPVAELLNRHADETEVA